MPGRRRASGLRRPLAILVAAAAILAPAVPARAAATWTRNLYVSSAFLYQDPYGNACTAASTMIMLNTIAYRHTGGPGFRWTPTRIKNDPNRANVRDLTSILWFARAHDTLSPSGSGSDPHGWRNALNYFGWGSAAMSNPALQVYQDVEYPSFDAAVRGGVIALARFKMPIGIVTWAGRHAQVMTGYEVYGDDPAVSSSFTVRAVYISDPLRADAAINKRVSYLTLKAGTLRLRFQAYREADSPYDDAYVPGWKRSSVRPTTGPSEWYQRWVVIVPVRAGLVADPPPSPDPAPTPPPTPTPPDATSTPSSEVTPTPAPAATPTATASGSTGPSAAASATASGSPGASTTP